MVIIMKKTATFEENMKRLEEIVEKLDGGEETLDGSLALYEEGARLAAACYDKLNAAQQRVTTFAKAETAQEDGNE